MAVTFRLSKKKRLTEHWAAYEVMARCHSGKLDEYSPTGVFVTNGYTDTNGNKKETWKDGSVVIPRISYSDPIQVELKAALTQAKERLHDIETLVERTIGEYAIAGRQLPKGWLRALLTTGKVDEVKQTKTFIETFQEFADSPRNNVCPKMRQQYHTIIKNLQRYEQHTCTTLTFDGLTPDILDGIKDFYINELDNSPNTALRRLRWMRVFIRWANGLNRNWPIEPITTNNPFVRYKMAQELYGTPFYLTIDERNKLYHADLPERLAKQRDIFVFQCLIGCRVSDLWSMTKDDIIDGAIEYIPDKTIAENPRRVRVPLNKQAREILDRYPNGDKLLPFVAQQQYNEDIKEMLKLAGITRKVTILNPKTRKEEKRPIYEVASSHMARRTFIGNLYKQVKDPNLVGKLSGHKEGSKAFVRYRDIDEDMAKELVTMLE